VSFSKNILIVFVIFLVIIDCILIIKLRKTYHEALKWKNKITLTINEQILLSEHKLEGIDLSKELELICISEKRFNEFFSQSDKYKLIYYFPGMFCRRCLNMEMRFFKNYKSFLEKNHINVLILFSNISQIDFYTLINQFNIKAISVLLNNDQFLPKIFGSTKDPVILLLTKENKIIYVNYSNYLDEEKSEKFYRKVIFVTRPF